MQHSLKSLVVSGLALLLSQGAQAQREAGPGPLVLSGSLETASNTCALTFPQGNKFDVGKHSFDEVGATVVYIMKVNNVSFAMDCTAATPMALKFSTVDEIQHDIGSAFNLALSADQQRSFAFSVVKLIDVATVGSSPVKANYAHTGRNSTPFVIDGNTSISSAFHGGYVNGYPNGEYGDKSVVTFVDDNRNLLAANRLAGTMQITSYVTPRDEWQEGDNQRNHDLNGQFTITAIYN